MLRSLIGCSIILTLLACGKEELPAKPQLIVDRDSIGFAQEFGSGTYIGTAPQESLLIENGGLETLTLHSATLQGDDAFTLEGPLKTELKGKERTFLRIIFSPTEEKQYQATITLSSNAENAPTKLIPVSGRGIRPDPDAGG